MSTLLLVMPQQSPLSYKSVIDTFSASPFYLAVYDWESKMCRHSMIWFPNEGSRPNSQEARDLEVSSKLVESYQLCSAKLRRLLKVSQEDDVLQQQSKSLSFTSEDIPMRSLFLIHLHPDQSTESRNSVESSLPSHEQQCQKVKKFPRDPSMKHPWDKPKNPSTIKNGYLKYPFAKPEDYDY
ncbi:hypothetical protein YC2023_080026 [Brassica napus]